MTARFTKGERQQIVREFAEQHGGVFDAAAFLGEVSQVGKVHPAFGWFEWDDARAAREHRLDQARDFARGLVVHFSVETIDRGKVKVVTATAPMLISPLAKRSRGGGYDVTVDGDGEQLAELCRQAAASIRWFMSRYEAAIARVGGDMAALQTLREQLEAANSVQSA